MSLYQKGLLFTIVGAICWGISGVMGESLFKEGIDATWVSVYRMFSAGVIMSALAGKQRGVMRLFVEKQNLVDFVLFSLIGMALCQYSYILAISYTDAGTATMLQYLGPAFIVFLVCFKRRKLPTAKEATALFLALLGVFLIATKLDISHLHINTHGLIWGIISAVGLVFYTLLPHCLIEQFGTMRISGYAMVFGSICLALVSKVWLIDVTLDAWALVRFSLIVLVGTVMSFYFYLTGVRLIGAVKASMIATLEPISAALFSWLLIGTSFDAYDIVGFICILSTVVLVSKK